MAIRSITRIPKDRRTCDACTPYRRNSHGHLAEWCRTASLSDLKARARGYARRFGLSPADGEDIFQQSWLLLIQKCTREGEEIRIEQPAHWFAGTMRLVALQMHLRQQGMNRRVSSVSLSSNVGSEQSAEPEWFDLEQFIFSLPLHLAQVVAYAVYDEVPLNRISGLLNKSERQIGRYWKQSLSMARRWASARE
jgi:DNA-directed RNA polymerase specialized sigma24 family protein